MCMCARACVRLKVVVGRGGGGGGEVVGNKTFGDRYVGFDV